MLERVVGTVVDTLEYIFDGPEPKPLTEETEETEESGWASLLDYWPKDLSPEGDHHSFSFEILDSGTFKEVEIKDKAKDSLQTASGVINPHSVFNSVAAPGTTKSCLKSSVASKDSKKSKVTFWDKKPAGNLNKLCVSSKKCFQMVW